MSYISFGFSYTRYIYRQLIHLSKKIATYLLHLTIAYKVKSTVTIHLSAALVFMSPLVV